MFFQLDYPDVLALQMFSALFIYFTLKTNHNLFGFGHVLWLIAMLGVEFLKWNAFDPSIVVLFDIFLLFLVILEMTILHQQQLPFFTFVLISNKLSAPLCRNHLLRPHIEFALMFLIGPFVFTP